MSRIIQNIKVGLDEDLEEKLQWLAPNFSAYHVLRQSVDARRRHNPHLVYSVEVFEQGEKPQEPEYPIEPVVYKGSAPLIIGSGPAGLFAALRLVERGIPCHIFEQGSESAKRMLAITRFWRYGELNPLNNVCFGEGGAGLYSDGKLITRIKSPFIPYVMQRLVKFGAPKEIQYLSNPHVGSDKIRRIIPKIRQYIQEKGGTFHFDTKMTALLTESSGGQTQVTGIKTHKGEVFRSDHIILACGHSADDLLTQLHQEGVFMEGKSFAVGLRIEHPQSLINAIQYRGAQDHPKLGSANYKLTTHDDQSGVGVYSFCMCPGGYVLSSGTEADGIVCNGMSNYNRNSPFANSAIVVTVDHQKSFGDKLFGGMEFRRQLEKGAKQMVVSAGGDRQLPAQTLLDFLNQKPGSVLKTSSPSGVVATRLDQLLPKPIFEPLLKAFEHYERAMKGFISPQAQLHGVESRTSCPLRITRDAYTLQSVSHKGLYPTGEGAGYAGGITSAACDGIKVAEAIVALTTSVTVPA